MTLNNYRVYNDIYKGDKRNTKMTYYTVKNTYLKQLEQEHITITKTLNIALRYWENKECVTVTCLRELQYANMALIKEIEKDIEDHLNNYSQQHFGKDFNKLPDDGSEQELIIDLAENCPAFLIE